MRAILDNNDLQRPRVLILGGEDVDARIELMNELAGDFDLEAAGTSHEIHDRFLENGYKYSYYPMKRGSSPIHDLATVASLASLLRKRRPDIVHTFDSKPCVYGRLAAKLAGVPIVVGTIPGLGSLYSDAGLAKRMVRSVYERLQRWASHASQLTVFQNHDDAREMTAAGVVPHDRCKVIPGSGVRTEVYDPAMVHDAERRRVRDQLGIAPEAVVVTMVSRVIRTKGVDEYASAAESVSHEFPQVRFLLVGPDDTSSMDRYTADELTRIKRHVIWPGVRRDIPQVLAASDVFVLPTFYREGIPRVLLEAASMGIPLVTTNSPGCNEVVEEGRNGYLVPVRDANALASAIAKFAASADLRREFGRCSRRMALEKFDLRVIAAQTRSMYFDLLEPSRRLAFTSNA